MRTGSAPVGEETSERYEYIPASVLVIEEACLKYACACTVRTASKPAQPIEKSTPGASLLAQVIVGKFVIVCRCTDKRRSLSVTAWKSRGRRGRPCVAGWRKCADLLNPLYRSLKEVLFQSKVIGTDDTGAKVLDITLRFARTGHLWPYYGDHEHPVILYDYTATRERAGPGKFLEGYRGYRRMPMGDTTIFFKDPARGLIEMGRWSHARRYFHKALESDQPRIGPGLPCC